LGTVLSLSLSALFLGLKGGHRHPIASHRRRVSPNVNRNNNHKTVNANVVDSASGTSRAP